MPDLHKTLILANVRQVDGLYHVDELAMATEHAPFRHKKKPTTAGSQRKRAKMEVTKPDTDTSLEAKETDETKP
jgi:hypothetical protein